MDSSYDVPDPSDWLDTPVSRLAPVEAALRCQVCKDFFNTPMITSCSHTFCSLCIRRCLTTDGICPTCRTQDQEIKLRPNTLIQELVDAFQAARPTILQLGEEVKAMTDKRVENGNERKRKFEDTEIGDDSAHEEVKAQRRRTRSQNGVSPATPILAMDQTEDDANDIDFVPDDGLIACPICSTRMQEEAVFSHLDIHNGPDIVPKSQTIPTRPRTKRELLHELDIWDKTQGRQILNSSNGGGNNPSVMHKDFDGAAWAVGHDQDFKTLIAKARRKANPKEESSDNNDDSRDNVSGQDASNIVSAIGSPLDHSRSHQRKRPPTQQGDATPRDTQSRAVQPKVDLDEDG